ncbi:unnamed protein product [Sphagnum tenellum]
MIGDCLTHLSSLGDATVDVVITSPPYNIGINYNNYSDKLPRTAYLAWLQDVGLQIKRVLKSDGAFFLNAGSTSVDPWLVMDIASVFRDLFILQNHIIWVKSISIGDDTVGHFKPINSKRFLNQCHESIFHFTLDGNLTIDRLAIGVPFVDKSNVKRRNHAQDKRCAGNNWFIPYDTVQTKGEKFNHPAGFPIALPLRCLMLHGSDRPLVVCDPFLGAGATIVAAQQLGHSGIGIELDPIYAQTAAKRLQAIL